MTPLETGFPIVHAMKSKYKHVQGKYFDLIQTFET
jgi:hypothetical protein